MEQRIVVVGLGLIGGSLIKAIKPLKPLSIQGIDHDASVIKKSFEHQLIDNDGGDAEAILSDADVVIVCLYPEATIDFIRKHQGYFKAGCIVTDVSGLKSNFMKTIKTFIRKDIFFIGGHPMAGKEGKGFDVSCPNIFIDANYLLMMDHQVPDHCYETLKDLIYKIGFKHIELLEAEEHDEIIAYTSHMPHVLASTLVNCNRFNKTKNCAAGSYNDFTRVAEINETLWAELFLENRQPLLNEIKSFKDMLTQLEDSIKNDSKENIERFLIEARRKKIQLKA